MNFLAHYYLLPYKEKHDMAFGNLLPDLMRGFSKVYNQELQHRKDLHSHEIFQGIEFHLKSDSLFHKHIFFERYCKRIKSSIEERELPQERSYVVAHILLELMMDRYLLLKEDALAEKFYQSLRVAQEENILNKLHYELNLKNSSKINLIFKGFIENEYGYRLRENSGIIEALEQILGKRLGINFKSKNWELLIDSFQGNLEESLPSFFNELTNALKNAT
ncbi:MAG: hypothetical protein H6579_07370 [Chitinophagales bacterium]|nr:hypothetical protein [Chitinophagales bacterium]